MKSSQTARVAIAVSLIIAGLILAIISLLWLAWSVDFGIQPQTFSRIVSVMVLGSFALFFVLLVVLITIERSNHYAGERTSRLHLPLIISTGALTSYFGIASIGAVDTFYDPSHTWPLLRDPTVRLLQVVIVFVVVLAKAWMLYEIIPVPWVRRVTARKHPAGRS